MTGGFPAALPIASILFPFALASRDVQPVQVAATIEVNRKRQQTLAIRWILDAVRTRKGRPTGEKLAQELVDCYNKTGTTIQKRENTHRMAEANKAFAHFA